MHGLLYELSLGLSAKAHSEPNDAIAHAPAPFSVQSLRHAASSAFSAPVSHSSPGSMTLLPHTAGAGVGLGVGHSMTASVGTMQAMPPEPSSSTSMRSPNVSLRLTVTREF